MKRRKLRNTSKIDFVVANLKYTNKSEYSYIFDNVSTIYQRDLGKGLCLNRTPQHGNPYQGPTGRPNLRSTLGKVAKNPHNKTTLFYLVYH
jgi:hypothetical protein